MGRKLGIGLVTLLLALSIFSAPVSACECTLTIGYWKTHAGFGPQPDMVTSRLPIWLGTAGGAKSIQVTTAAQAVNILSMSGDASNGINKLYAQLLGAKLNGADGAVASTIAAADTFLATHNAADWSGLPNAQKAQVLGWMTTLDNFNNGLIGPGHCSENSVAPVPEPMSIALVGIGLAGLVGFARFRKDY